MTGAILITCVLSLVVALAELFSKFRDEPFLVIKNLAAWAYIFLNIMIAIICLLILTQTNLLGSKDLDLIHAALLSGLGSAVIMRSKFLKININDKEAAIGPEIIINVFLETLEKTIDRDRALTRKQLVEKSMSGIDFNKAGEYVITTIIAARQLASIEDTRKLMDEFIKIKESSMDNFNKSNSLGYLILDLMGEKFLKSFFNEEDKKQFLVLKSTALGACP